MAKKLCVSPTGGGSNTSPAPYHEEGVVVLRALQRRSLRCVHIAGCLSLLIYGCVINKIISSVTKYFKFASLPPPSPSAPPSRTKKVKEGG